MPTLHSSLRPPPYTTTSSIIGNKPRAKLAAKPTRAARLKHKEVNKASGSRRLVLDQANFKGSRGREKLFLNFRASTNRHADIIVGCDTSTRAAWKSTGQYHLEMKTDRALVESDNPDDPNRHLKKGRGKGRKPKSSNPADDEPQGSPVTMARVFFLVHKSIARESWNVEWHEGKNAGMVATLHLALGDNGGDLAIHAVYNPNQPDKAMTIEHIEELLATTTRSGRDIVMGDFNLHHPSWSASLYRGDPAAVSGTSRTLHDGMHANGMNLATDPGTETFFATNKDKVIRSCIDLTFVSSSLKSSVKSCSAFPRKPVATEDGATASQRSLYNPWPNTDHHPVRTILDLQVERDDTLKFHYEDTDTQEFNAILEKGLNIEELKKLKLTPAVIEEQLKHVTAIIMHAINTTVPTSLAFPPPIDKPMSLLEREVIDGNGVAPAPPHTISNSVAQQQYHEALKRDRDKEKTFIDKVAQSPNGTWQAAKIGKVRSQPRIIKNMPALFDSHGDKHSTPEAKIALMAKSIWANNDKPEVVPLPYLPPDRKVLTMDKSLGTRRSRRSSAA